MDFSVDPGFQEKLVWMSRFIREQVEPLDSMLGKPGEAFKVAQAPLGALGTPRDTPRAKMRMGVPMLAVADGPAEVQKD